MKITVKNLKNKSVKEIELPESIFAYPYKEHLIHATVVANLAARRAGTHATKTRAEVRGGGRKPWRQKGTGRARVGSIRSPLWRSGGTVHGPQPRSYKSKLSPRERRNALKSALSKRFEEENIHVIETLELDRIAIGRKSCRVSSMGSASRARFFSSTSGTTTSSPLRLATTRA